jgi:hypothetical protein
MTSSREPGPLETADSGVFREPGRGSTAACQEPGPDLCAGIQGVFDFLPLGARPAGLAVASHGQVLLGKISCLIHMYLMSQVR